MSYSAPVRLDELCTFQRGLTYSKSDEVDSSGNGVLRANNIDQATNTLNLRDIRYISDSISVPPNKKVKRGSLLICTASGSRSHLGKVAIIEADYDLAFGGFMGLITPKPTIESRYLFYSLSGGPFQKKLDSLAGGTNINNLKFSDIADFEIPLPPLDDQRRIVAVLDEAFAAIATATANAEQNLANVRELFSSELRQLFKASGAAWDWRPIGEVADARLGKMLDKAKNKGVPRSYLRNLNVRWFRFDLSDLLEMPFEESESEKYSAKRGDLMIIEGGYPGRAAIWDSDEPIFFQKAVHRVRFDDPRLAKLLMYMLFAQHGDGTLAKHFSGAGIQHLTGQSLAKILMPLPPVDEREGIISKVESTLAISEEAQRLYETKINRLNSLKQSLLHRAFSGELTEREPLAA